jgi:hypothetical protein
MMEHQDILELVDDLKKFESVSKKLQSGDTERASLHDARLLFDGLILEFEGGNSTIKLSQLHADHPIVQCPDFENGVVNLGLRAD